ncbi:2-C-methyl-D-erythritol 4-phosphate cytidylyltransferase [Spiroplasma syrphidicola EA-1]|uniref:2-C-methyl-D-erythritol 4-phosphate cytidylyltransferase n=1 Tax=Spiroplasma syrphidicola EA-1 TaxID=1276229 RepID=R4UCK5_9MOLU|nr:2-C-methyl-D-erythritol 4-phosphate cytidylyltransferase [Spiroplasma syrphidicola]AGM25619.1 2-C-methyl-D-erythritol 4-phosphate cytidylyltransferase [Spiroplasma syrphidicola EA-1]
MENYTVIIPAAGTSQRFKHQDHKLLYRGQQTERVIEKTIRIFLEDPFCHAIIIGVNDLVGQFLQEHYANEKKITLVKGKDNRADTVLVCLQATEIKTTLTLVHDGARCFLTPTLRDQMVTFFEQNNCQVLIPVLPITDTIRMMKNNKVVKTMIREELVTVQTPQLFKTAILQKAYQCYHQQKTTLPSVIYDDAYLIELFCPEVEITTIVGEQSNQKITYYEDVKFGKY